MATPNLQVAFDVGYKDYLQGYSRDVNPWAQDGEDWGFHLAWQAGWEGAVDQVENSLQHPVKPVWCQECIAYHVECEHGCCSV